jgi:hypothetical protein
LIPFQLHRRIPWIRRAFHQRDQVVYGREGLAATLERVAAELDYVKAQRDQIVDRLESANAERNRALHALDRTIPFAGGIHQLRAAFAESDSADLPATPFAETPMPSVVDDDEALVSRIIMAYRLSVWEAPGPSGSFWETAFFDLKRDVHAALIAGDNAAVCKMLRDPGQTDLFYGFDNLARSLSRTGDHGTAMYLDLLLLSEAIGARELWSPEYVEPVLLPQVEELLELLDGAMGFHVTFPNPFAGEIGLATSRGVASYRAVQALYQAWRIAGLLGERPNARVLEIGAGLGRTAFYARQFGIFDYTIIDLPLTAVAQANFIGRTLGADAICLFGETRPGIRILPPPAFMDASDRYDLVVNVDSLTELTPETARAYCDQIKAQADLFLSIKS